MTTLSFSVWCQWCGGDVTPVNTADLESEQKVVVRCVACAREALVWVRLLGMTTPAQDRDRLRTQARRARLRVVR